MSICTLNAARPVILEHRYIMWLYKLQGPERCNLSSGGLMPRARDSAAMHHPQIQRRLPRLSAR